MSKKPRRDASGELTGDVDAALEGLGKPELITLVKRMLREDPELKRLLEAPRQGSGPGAATPEAYRKQGRDVIRGIGYGDGSAGGIAAALEPLRATGDDFLRAKDYAGAAAVYQGLCAAVAETYDMLEDSFDEENALGTLVAECVGKLAQCLDGLKDDPTRREVILRGLWDVERSGLELGEGEEDEVTPTEVLVRHTTPEERHAIAGWVRAAVPRGKEGSASWHRQAYGGLLLELEADTMDDEAYLRVCRETGRRHDLVERLLQLGRLEEAAEEVGKAPDHELLRLADLLVHHRHGDLADRVVQERAQKSKGWHRQSILGWLKMRAAGRHDQAADLELTEMLFRNQPSLEGYRELKAKATKQRRWAQLQPELLAFLKQSRSRHVLTQVYLEEGEIDLALEAIKGEKHYGPRFDFSMAREVARAAEEGRPQAALEIYRKQAEALIQGRSRGSYDSACRFLGKVRDLYKRVGDPAGWVAYVSRLREKHRALRALMDEMTKARL
jgi:hypothetical protein